MTWLLIALALLLLGAGATLFLYREWAYSEEDGAFYSEERTHSCDEIVQSKEKAEPSSEEARIFLSHGKNFGIFGPAKWLNEGL